MKIEVVDESTKTKCIFKKYGNGKRLWLIDEESFFYPSIGWCPHINLDENECRDCSLIIGDDE